MLSPVSALADECETPTGNAAKAISRLYAKIDGNNEGACILYGDYSGDGRNDGLAFLYFSPPGGNGVFLEVHKLRQTARRQFESDGTVEIFGVTPRDARFSRGRIEVTTSVQGPNDPRCCPTEEKRWVVNAR
ncbi:hypothetical protein [Aureimonas sp. SA4125]|uniref:hypothetical protein n=1 Tax=Aureimonas sp. SA4125 TaxID=2826993 RepID=UPI001CC43FA1|nr:hypothetical protein [Aureimonas sp. SA4125]